MKNETWKPIENFEGYYEVSSLGRVRSVDRERCHACKYPGRKGRIIKGTINSANGYSIIAMSRPGLMGETGRKTYTATVHRLVAQAFVIGRTKERNVVNHKDGNKRNNNADNLEWLSLSENNIHAIRLGLAKPKTPPNPWFTYQGQKVRGPQNDPRRFEQPDAFH